MKTLLIFGLFFLRTSVAQKEEITAVPGQNVTLPCRAPNNKILTGVEWSRADLESEYVLLYRNGKFVPNDQHPSFKYRVDLQDRQMKDGDVSLILKDVMINDTGTYECRALTQGGKREKRAIETISIITLVVVAPPGPGGGTVGLIVGLSVSAVVLLVAAAVGFLIYRRTRDQSPASSQPAPVELQLLEHV